MNFTTVTSVFFGFIVVSLLLVWYTDWTSGTVDVTFRGNSSNSRSSSIKLSVSNWSVIYNEESVYQTIHTIHNKFFTAKENDSCEQRPPAAYIVGVAKSGTRELTDFMHVHPNIVIRTFWKPDRGNVYQLSPDLFQNVKNEPNEVIRWLPCTYSNQFGLVKADYFFFSDDIAQSLKILNPKMKIIVILKEPISRMFSYFMFTHPWLNEAEMSDKFIRTIFNRKGDIKDSDQLKMSTYVYGLQTYLKYFPRDQILILEGNNFKQDPVGVFKNVTSFLGLEQFPAEEHFVYNHKKGFYCIRNSEVVNTMNCYEGNRGKKTTLELEPRTKQKLSNFFSEKNEQFFSLAGQRFDWVYW